MRRVALWSLWAFILGVVAFAGVECDHRNGARWIGGFDLDVHLDVADVQSVKAVSATMLGRSEWTGVPSQIDAPWQRVNLENGLSFKITVGRVGRWSYWGRDLGYTQHEWLVLKVEYADGETKYLPTHIPHGTEQRNVSVHVP